MFLIKKIILAKYHVSTTSEKTLSLEVLVDVFQTFDLNFTGLIEEEKGKWKRKKKGETL